LEGFTPGSNKKGKKNPDYRLLVMSWIFCFGFARLNFAASIGRIYSRIKQEGKKKS